MKCKHCGIELKFGVHFVSPDCCYKCHEDIRVLRPMFKRNRIGRWSGARGNKSDYSF